MVNLDSSSEGGGITLVVCLLRHTVREHARLEGQGARSAPLSHYPNTLRARLIRHLIV
jgi:hypothetical protein